MTSQLWLSCLHIIVLDQGLPNCSIEKKCIYTSQKCVSHVLQFAKFMLLSALDSDPFLSLGFSPLLVSKPAVSAESGRDGSQRDYNTSFFIQQHPQRA